MVCINECGKECCKQPPEKYYEECLRCKGKTAKWYVCSNEECRHMFDFIRMAETIQICMPDMKCVYICKADCVYHIHSISEFGMYMSNEAGIGQYYEFSKVSRRIGANVPKTKPIGE